jgi:hypothetical protein
MMNVSVFVWHVGGLVVAVSVARYLLFRFSCFSLADDENI